MQRSHRDGREERTSPSHLWRAGGHTAAHQIAQEIFTIWIEGVAALARESGMSPAKARQFGEDWIARVQGSLILYAANGDCGPFEPAMAQLADLAKGKQQ